MYLIPEQEILKKKLKHKIRCQGNIQTLWSQIKNRGIYLPELAENEQCFRVQIFEKQMFCYSKEMMTVLS